MRLRIPPAQPLAYLLRRSDVSTVQRMAARSTVRRRSVMRFSFTAWAVRHPAHCSARPPHIERADTSGVIRERWVRNVKPRQENRAQGSSGRMSRKTLVFTGPRLTFGPSPISLVPQ